MAVTHSYSALWDEYPDYENYPDPAEVKKMIGGSVNGAWVTNTCAVRLSRAVNYNGTRVPGNFAGLVTEKGGDGRRYALRVREMDVWLRFVFGKPQFEAKKKEGTTFDKSSIASLRGIIGFDIRFSDATGHLDLWDGKKFSAEKTASKDYFTHATRVWVWTAK